METATALVLETTPVRMPSSPICSYCPNPDVSEEARKTKL